MSKGFKIVCMECGKEYIVTYDEKSAIYIDWWGEGGQIECECGNYIEL